MRAIRKKRSKTLLVRTVAISFPGLDAEVGYTVYNFLSNFSYEM